MSASIHRMLKACEAGDVDVILALLEKDNQLVNCSDEQNELTPLQVAAANGHIDAVRKLLLMGATVDQTNVHSWTALMQACRNGHEVIAACLIQNSANIDACNKLGATSLHLAATGGHHRICKLLVEKECEANSVKVGQSPYEHSPLMCAAQCGFDDVVKYLIDNRSDVNYCAISTGVNALMLAAANGHMTTAQILVERGANPNTTNINGHTALDIAILMQKRDVKEYLEKKTTHRSKKVQDSDKPEIIEAVKNGNFKKVKEILQSNRVKHRDICSHKEGATPLMFAAMIGHLDIVSLLIESGCDINKQDTVSGWTALMQATYHGRTKVAFMLLRAGADASIQAHTGCTAFDLASLIDDVDTDLFRVLASQVISDSAPNNEDSTPVMLAQSSLYGAQSESNLLQGHQKTGFKAWWYRLSNRFRHLKKNQTMNRSPSEAQISTIGNSHHSSTSRKHTRSSTMVMPTKDTTKQQSNLKSSSSLKQNLPTMGKIEDFEKFKQETQKSANLFTLNLKPEDSTLGDGCTLKPVKPPFLPYPAFESIVTKPKKNTSPFEVRSPSVPLDPTMSRPMIHTRKLLAHSSTKLSPPGSDQSPSSSAGAATLAHSERTQHTNHTAATGLSSASSSTLTASSEQFNSNAHLPGSSYSSRKRELSAVHGTRTHKSAKKQTRPKSQDFSSKESSSTLTPPRERKVYPLPDSHANNQLKDTTTTTYTTQNANTTCAATTTAAAAATTTSAAAAAAAAATAAAAPTSTTATTTTASDITIDPVYKPKPETLEEDLSKVLSAIALQEYQPIFEEQEVDMEAFLMLSEADLKDLGIWKQEPRNQILTVINELKVGKGRERNQFHETMNNFHQTTMTTGHSQ